MRLRESSGWGAGGRFLLWSLYRNSQDKKMTIMMFKRKRYLGKSLMELFSTIEAINKRRVVHRKHNEHKKIKKTEYFHRKSQN